MSAGARGAVSFGWLSSIPVLAPACPAGALFFTSLNVRLTSAITTGVSFAAGDGAVLDANFEAVCRTGIHRRVHVRRCLPAACATGTAASSVDRVLYVYKRTGCACTCRSWGGADLSRAPWN